MFLLFQFLRYHHGFCFQDLHSNMFLLFHRCTDFNSGILQFTFQYVSIISEISNVVVNLFVEFTFQYVSIISKVTELKESAKESIYIPICFYYFDFFNLAMQDAGSHLHSNMFLLFKRFRHSVK